MGMCYRQGGLGSMTLEEAIRRAEEVAYLKDLKSGFETDNERYAMTDDEKAECKKCVEEHRQLAKWLKELRVFKSRKGEWLRMSDLSEKEDDRYQCSYCRNVVHYKDKMDLYTFNSWCGRCGSNNGRKIEVEL